MAWLPQDTKRDRFHSADARTIDAPRWAAQHHMLVWRCILAAVCGYSSYGYRSVRCVAVRERVERQARRCLLCPPTNVCPQHLPTSLGVRTPQAHATSTPAPDYDTSKQCVASSPWIGALELLLARNTVGKPRVNTCSTYVGRA